MTPQFRDFAEFIAMDGYGGYVWTAWGLSFLVIIFSLVFPYLAQKKWQKRVSELEALLAAKKKNEKN
jgi:heme exporter protein D